MSANHSPRRRVPLLSRSHTDVIALVGLACVAICVFGPRPRAQEAHATFRARTELVRLDVSVADGRGRPVGDLRSEELLITENGEPRPVVLFRHVAEADEADGDLNARAFQEVSANSLPPNGRLYVLIFDQPHLDAAQEQRARLAAERFVTQQLKPGDAIAVYGLPGPGPMLNLTTDLVKARLALAALHGQARRQAFSEFDTSSFAARRLVARDPGSSPWPLDIGAVMSGAAVAPITALRQQATPAVVQADTEPQILLSQMAGVMQKLQVLDGRKTFILFSAGFPADNLAPRLEQVASAAARSNSAVFPIDLGAMRPEADPAASTLPVAATSARRDPLAWLAAETNGRMVLDGNNLDRALTGIAAEAADYYVVGFEPAASDASRGYHRVKVQTTRRGLVVRARTGYGSVPETTTVGDREAIDVALAVPRTSTAIPIEYTTYERSGPGADKPRIIASVSAYLPSRANDAVDDRDRGEIVFVVRDTVTGQAVASGRDRLAAARPRSATGGAAALEAVPYCVQFDVPPGEYWMRVLVREPGGVIGTADRRFHVWPLDGRELTTSDLIVTRLNGARFDPPAHAAVHGEDDVLAYLEIYGAPRSVEPHVEILRAGSADVLATADPIVKAGSHGESIVRARLPVETLAAGEYTARVRVLTAGGVARTLVRMFSVLPRQALHIQR